ncbi:MAG: PAS domain S-box protein, partial [Betaproteobacteria bacterium]|nr:PAS domain S-box protein [Betaproteobacteria bacterium]
MEFMGDFLGRQGYLPHGYCFTWTPALLWSMVTADAVVALSYFSIPAVIVAFLRRRPDVPYRWVAVLFSVFIFACGTTHVMDIWTIWTPDYGLHAVTKMFTAVVSVATAVGLWPLLPKILKIPSVKQLQDAISALESEVAKRKTAEEHLADTEQSLSATLDLIGAGFITIDADGRILRMNPVAERITGWQLTQAAQRRLAEVFRVATGSDTDGRLFESIHALAGDHATEHSLCLESAQGVRTMVSLTCALNRSEAGELRGLTMLIRDETQLKTAESAADRLAKIVESSTDAIVSMDLDGTIVSWNSAAQDLFGYAPNEAIGKSVLMLVPDDQAPEESIILGNLASGLRVPPYDATRRHRDGRSVSVSV